MKTPALKKSKYYINTGSFRHHNNCGSTHPSRAASEENKLPSSFSGFKTQKFLHESSYDGVSGTDNDEQSLKNLSTCLSSLAARSVLLFQNGSILIVKAPCNASVKSSCAQPCPPPPRATAGHLPALSVLGVEHLQILHCPGAGHLPTPGPFPSF